MNNTFMNPMQLAQALRQGGDRQQIISQYARQSPSFNRTMQSINGRTPEQILDMAEQKAQALGVNLDQLAQRLGVTLPR